MVYELRSRSRSRSNIRTNESPIERSKDHSKLARPRRREKSSSSDVEHVDEDTNETPRDASPLRPTRGLHLNTAEELLLPGRNILSERIHRPKVHLLRKTRSDLMDETNKARNNSFRTAQARHLEGILLFQEQPRSFLLLFLAVACVAYYSYTHHSEVNPRSFQSQYSCD